jgi:hypothetical protein
MVDLTDTDGDSIPDRVEQWYANQGYGMNANDPNDALGDLDGDSYSNRQAYQQGWNFMAHLNQYDDDADGILDVLEDAWSAALSRHPEQQQLQTTPCRTTTTTA